MTIYAREKMKPRISYHHKRRRRSVGTNNESTEECNIRPIIIPTARRRKRRSRCNCNTTKIILPSLILILTLLSNIPTSCSYSYSYSLLSSPLLSLCSSPPRQSLSSSLSCHLVVGRRINNQYHVRTGNNINKLQWRKDNIINVEPSSRLFGTLSSSEGSRNNRRDDNDNESTNTKTTSTTTATIIDDASDSTHSDQKHNSKENKKHHETKMTTTTTTTSTKESSITKSNSNNIKRTIAKNKPKDDADVTIRRKQRQKIRMKIYKFQVQPIVEVMSLSLVLLSSFLVAISTLKDIPYETAVTIDTVQEIINYIFAIDFMFRWYSAGQFKVKYLTKPLAIIDLLVTILPLALEYVGVLLSLGQSSTILLPSWLMSNSGLLNLRLLRILRLRRVLTDMTTFNNFSKEISFVNTGQVRPYQLQLARVLLSLFTLLSVSSGLIYTAEHEVNEQIPDYFTALYFGLTTLTTVGFGDITPITAQGRLVVMGSILVGIAVIPAQAAKFVEALLDAQRINDNETTLGTMKTKKSLLSTTQMMTNSVTTTSSSSSLDSSDDTYTLTNTAKTAAIVDSIKEDQINANQKQYPRVIATSAKDDIINNSPSLKKATSTAEERQISQEITCQNCGAEFHWNDAIYCWSCGSSLFSDNTTDVISS